MRLLSLALFATIGPLGFAKADESKDSVTQLCIEIKLFEQAKTEAKKKVSANPKIVVTPSHPFQFHSGGTVRTRNGGDVFHIGTRIHGKLVPGEDGKFKLSASVSVGNLAPTGGKDIEAARTETLSISGTLALHKTRRFRYSESGWCSITLEPVITPKTRRDDDCFVD